MVHKDIITDSNNQENLQIYTFQLSFHLYSVCSFEPEETIQQLQWIQNNFEDKIEVVDPSSRLPDSKTSLHL